MPKPLVYPPKPTTEQPPRWYHMQAPRSWHRMESPGEQGRVMWLLLDTQVAEIMLKNGWREVK